MTPDEAHDLLPYCLTDHQRLVLRHVAEHGVNKTADELKLNRRTIQRLLERIQKHKVLRADDREAGLLRPLPAPLQLERVTQTLNPDGTFGQVWVKSKVSQDHLRVMLEEAVEAYKADIPKVKPVKRHRIVTGADAQLLNLFVCTDYHIGMYAWPEETRDDPWDTDIAVDLLYRWMERAILMAPPAKHGVFANIGDFLHFSGLLSITPQSGHILDTDTRFQRIVRLTIQVIRRIVALMLQSYETVTLLMAEGNHDRDASPWLQEMFAAFYEHEPRLKVILSPDPYYCIEHGQTSLFFHHGHLSKMEKVDRVFAGKFRDVFGRTKHSYAHMGHYHHEKVLESELMIVKQHRTIAPSDAYAGRGGWLSGREAEVITYHSQFGRTGTVSVTPEMLKEVA